VTPGSFGRSEPVPFTAGTFGGPAGAGFGTPDPSYGGPAGVGFGTPDSFAQAPQYGPAGAGAGVYGAPTETAGGAGAGVPKPRTAAGDTRGVTLTAAGRRFSCTLVLGAACVLAALSGGLYATGLLPGQGEHREVAGKPPQHSPAPAGSAPDSAHPSASPSGSQAPPKGTRADVPKELIGTWKGTVTTHLGATSQFEITIKGGRTGEVVARDKSVLPLLGTDCSGDWKLVSATDRSLVLDTAGGPNPAPGICAGGSADERFSLNAGGSLHYTSGDKAAGNPEGDLTRSP
ncbi:hypothetical protein AB0E73_13375, partial [Streptomyces sp. NPDC031705]